MATGVPLPAREPGVYWDEPGSPGDSTPGAEQTILSFTAGGSGKRRLSSIRVACAFDGRWRVLVDGDQIGGGLVQPGAPESEQRWWPGKPLADGAAVEVLFKAFNSTPVTTVQAWAHGYDAP